MQRVVEVRSKPMKNTTKLKYAKHLLEYCYRVDVFKIDRVKVSISKPLRIERIASSPANSVKVIPISGAFANCPFALESLSFFSVGGSVFELYLHQPLIIRYDLSVLNNIQHDADRAFTAIQYVRIDQ